MTEMHSIVFLIESDCSDHFVSKPLDTFPVFPEAELGAHLVAFFAWLSDDIFAEAVLLATAPVALVASAVCPFVDAVTVLFVVLVLSFKAAAISPPVLAEPIHIVVFPLTSKLATVQP